MSAYFTECVLKESMPAFLHWLWRSWCQLYYLVCVLKETMSALFHWVCMGWVNASFLTLTVCIEGDDVSFIILSVYWRRQCQLSYTECVLKELMSALLYWVCIHGIYVSIILTLSVYSTLSLSLQIWRSSLMARMLTPGSLGVPIMVYVLPEPVWPYANIHTLYPSTHDVMMFLASSNTYNNAQKTSIFFSDLHYIKYP